MNSVDQIFITCSYIFFVSEQKREMTLSVKKGIQWESLETGYLVLLSPQI
jgi:hypothetical protein